MSKVRGPKGRGYVRVRVADQNDARNFEQLARAKLAEFRYVFGQLWREMERMRSLVGGCEASEDWRNIGAEVCDSRVMYLRCRVCLRVWTIRGPAAEKALDEFRANDNPLHEYGDMVDVYGCQGPGCRVPEDEVEQCDEQNTKAGTAKL